MLWVPLVVSIVGAAAACGSEGVADMDAIFERAPQVVDVTAYSARVIAVTNIDAACAVAYGPTQEYGQLATDDDMAGTGHADHHPLLTGLQPNTIYHLKFGGIGPDGTVYSSQDITFRTLPVDSGVERPSGENVALLSKGARVVGTSSNFGGAENDEAWGGNRAIDGNATTQWSSDGDGDDAWIEIELPTEARVTSLGFWTRTMGSSAEIVSFQVVSDRGDARGPFELDHAASVQYFVTDLIAKRLRFEVVESSGGNTGAVEIEVYADPVR